METLVNASGAECYGLQIVRMSDGQIPRGSVYVLLDRLEEKGFVSSREETRDPHVSGISRRLYRPTGLGLRVLTLMQQYEGLFLTPDAEPQGTW